MYQLLNEMCEDTLLSACFFEWHKIFSEEKKWKMTLLSRNSENWSECGKVSIVI
jgi:hypothetical protein